MNESETPDSPEDQLPHEVVAALRERHGPGGNIPASVDESILQDAKAHLSSITRPKTVVTEKRRFAWVAWSSGTIAAAVLLFALLPNANEAPVRSVAVHDATPESVGDSIEFNIRDVDQDGEINILDAFALARTIESGDSEMSRWDQNGDGKTDHLDIKLVADTAVML